MSGKNKKKFDKCPNCNYTFGAVNNYCANCGQENHDLNMPFSHVVLEVLEGTFHFDTKVFRTLKLLLFKPGRLTAEFIQNRRAPYVPPIRLYIFVSFIFFLVLAADVLHKGDEAAAAVSETETVEIADGIKITRREMGRQGPIAFDFGDMNSEEIKTMHQWPDARLNESLKTSGFETTDFNRTAVRKLSKFLAYDKDVQMHKFIKMLSVLMFLLMPLFALIMKSAYFRHKIHYIQFLIISLHYHCFVFLILTTAFLLEVVFGWNVFITAAMFISLLYLLLEQRFLFRQKLLKTILKSGYIIGLYGLALALSMVLAMVLSVAL